MNENETTAPTVVKPARVSAEQFSKIWNASESRNDVIARLATAGFVMTYSAVVARAKTYKEAGANLKDMPHAPKGKRIDVAALNAKLAEPSQPTS